MSLNLNRRASQLVSQLPELAAELRIESHSVAGATIYDFGINAQGGLQAGLKLAQICMSGLADIKFEVLDYAGTSRPSIQVVCDHPLPACLYSQYAGWQVAVEKYFAMGSGPMRAASGREAVFQKFGYRETPEHVVGVFEGRKLPTPAVLEFLSAKTDVPADRTTLLIAPTASQAGNVQVVARVVETAMHKLFDLGFDLQRIVSAWGTAPLPPVAENDLTGIGRTNDAILYGGRVTLWVRGDDASIAEIGPKVPSTSSPSFGQSFLQIFEAAGRDFYKIDPHLFSPAEVTFQNLDTGKVQTFGRLSPDVLKSSFGC